MCPENKTLTPGSNLAIADARLNEILREHNPVPRIVHPTVGIEQTTKENKKLHEGRIIHLYCYKNKKNSIKAGSVLVYGVTECTNLEYEDVKAIPKTTKNEVFCHRLEDGTMIECNGGFVLHLPISTSGIVSLMKKYVLEFIELSKTYTTSRSITSQWCSEKKERTGILMNNDVYNSLIQGGEIYNAVFELGYELRLTEASEDSTSKHLKKYKRYASISW